MWRALGGSLVCLYLASMLIACASGITQPSVSTPPVAAPVAPSAPVATPITDYHAYGDSITAGATLSDDTLAYPNLVAEDLQLSLSKFAVAGQAACDVAPLQIFAHNDNPAAGAFPLYTLLIGTNDAVAKGAGGFEADFNLCQQASIAWLAVPADLKILPPSAGVATTGLSSIDTTYNFNAWTATVAGSSISFPVTLSAAGAIYLWPRMIDADPGAFAYSLDGIVAGTFNTSPSMWIESPIGTTEALGFVRIPDVAAGQHTVTLTKTVSGGTIGIVAAGAVPNTKRSLPTVVVGDIPVPETGSSTRCAVTPSVCAAYNADIRANVAILASDGLDVRFADNNSYMHGTPAEMNDPVHPNTLGQSELRYAFEAWMAGL